MDELLSSLNIASALGWLDIVIVCVAIGILFVITYLTGREEKDTEDYFLGRRRVPALVACLSFVAAEVSAVTIVTVPAEGFRSNLGYLQFFIGSAAARVFVAFLFVPIFYKFNCTTIYEFLRERFGRETQYAGSVFFFITRLLGSGVRLYAACLGVSLIMGWGLKPTLVLFTIASILMIGFGGIKAVVWTGAFETVFFYLAGGAVVAYLMTQINGGLTEAWRVAGEAKKLTIFNLHWSLADANTLWAAAISTTFLNLSVFGTDQDFMQRMLTVRTRRSSQKAIMGTIAAAFPLVCLYLGLGVLLYVFYQQNPAQLPEKTDKIFSYFTVHTLPMGLKGLVLAAIVLASIDSPLNSLTASFVTDIYRPLINKTASDRHYLWVSRFGVVGFGLVLAALAFGFSYLDQILWVAFQVLGVTGGSLLGVFLLGLLTKRRANWANVVAMVVSSVCMATMMVLINLKVVDWLGWTWLVVIGTGMTFAIGYALGPRFERRKMKEEG